MFAFEREQYIYDIGNIRIGGMPGETPTALAGTIFYSGHKIVKNAEKGIFDKNEAERLVNAQDRMADLTGNPALVQIFAESDIAMERYIDFVTDITDAPFLIDSTEPEARVAGLLHSEEVGLLDRAIYNSINFSIAEKEKEALMDIQHDCAIVLAFNPQDASIAGRRAVLEGGAKGMDG